MLRRVDPAVYAHHAVDTYELLRHTQIVVSTAIEGRTVDGLAEVSDR